jgi:hypothetical protein
MRLGVLQPKNDAIAAAAVSFVGLRKHDATKLTTRSYTFFSTAVTTRSASTALPPGSATAWRTDALNSE